MKYLIYYFGTQITQILRSYHNFLGNCPTLDFDHGTVIQKGNQIGNQALLKCRDGFQISGSAVGQCLPSGKWSGLSGCTRKKMNKFVL